MVPSTRPALPQFPNPYSFSLPTKKHSFSFYSGRLPFLPRKRGTRPDSLEHLGPSLHRASCACDMRSRPATVVALLFVTYYSCQNLGATKMPSRVVHKLVHRMMEGYSALKRMGYQATRRHEGAISAYY